MTDTHDLPHPLLLDYLDGLLDDEQTRAVEVWIAEDGSRERLVAQHREVWDALAFADPARDVTDVAPSFSRALVERVRADGAAPRTGLLRLRAWRMAAAVLIGAGLWTVLHPTAPTPRPLAVSSSSGELELLEQYGDDLDIIGDYQALQAIEGQLDGVLPR